MRRWRPNASRTMLKNWAVAAVVVFVLFENMNVSRFFERSFPTLSEQRSGAAEIASHLQPGDKIFIYGRTEILVLLGATNVSKYFILDRGKDEYLDEVEEGGFTGWLERLKGERPKIVAIDRIKKTPYLNSFLDWVSAEYAPRDNGVFPYYIRKDDVR